MIENILIDVDGVLNDFVGELMRRHGFPDYHHGMYPIECGYNISAAIGKFLGAEIPREKFWGDLDREFWATVPKSAEADIILGYANSVVPTERMCIATAPTHDPLSAAGKVDWIYSKLPKVFARQFLIGAPKQFMAHPHALLVDDSDENVATFRRWGGQAFLVPRPWNSAYGQSTMVAIHDFFQRELQQRATYCLR